MTISFIERQLINTIDKITLYRNLTYNGFVVSFAVPGQHRMVGVRGVDSHHRSYVQHTHVGARHEERPCHPSHREPRGCLGEGSAKRNVETLNFP